jgi:hypothetical protein
MAVEADSVEEGGRGSSVGVASRRAAALEQPRRGGQPAGASGVEEGGRRGGQPTTSGWATGRVAVDGAWRRRSVARGGDVWRRWQ